LNTFLVKSPSYSSVIPIPVSVTRIFNRFLSTWVLQCSFNYRLVSLLTDTVIPPFTVKRIEFDSRLRITYLNRFSFPTIKNASSGISKLKDNFFLNI